MKSKGSAIETTGPQTARALAFTLQNFTKFEIYISTYDINFHLISTVQRWKPLEIADQAIDLNVYQNTNLAIYFGTKVGL